MPCWMRGWSQPGSMVCRLHRMGPTRSSIVSHRRKGLACRLWMRVSVLGVRTKSGDVVIAHHCNLCFNPENSTCGESMIRHFLAVTIFAMLATFSHAQPALPSSFQSRTVHSPAGADIFVRWGGSGPAVVLIHGYAENSDSWAPLALDLMADHTVIVPDLRGIGKSSKPESGYDKKTQAQDIRSVVTALGCDQTFVVAHDIGNMVAY